MIHEEESVLTDQECDSLLAYIKKTTPPTIGMKTAPMILDLYDDQYYQKFISSIINLTESELDKLEDPLITKYGVGGDYGAHYDAFYISEEPIHNQEFYDCCMSYGGQRIKTAVLYLNDDFDGGHTVFPLMNKCIKPKKGKCIWWSNVQENGEIDKSKIHAAEEVTKGEKYVIVIYIRQNKFIRQKLV